MEYVAWAITPNRNPNGGTFLVNSVFCASKNCQDSFPERFKSFPVQSDEHLWTVLRYVERNPVRAGLADRAEGWRWGSAWARRPAGLGVPGWLVTPREPPLPRSWLRSVNEPQTDEELQVLRHCIRRSCPFGDDAWATSSAVRLNLESTRRPCGRPRKQS